MVNGQGKKIENYRESKQHKHFSKERLFSRGSWWPLPWWEVRAQYAVCEEETLYLYAEFGRLIGLRVMETRKDLKIRIRRNHPLPGRRCRSGRGPLLPHGARSLASSKSVLSTVPFCGTLSDPLCIGIKIQWGGQGSTWKEKAYLLETKLGYGGFERS